MKGDKKVIDLLNKLLTGELTAADQYLAHSQMYKDWGLNKLYERLEHEREEEIDHAKALIERILFLEGTPDIASRNALSIGKDVKEMLENDLKAEYGVRDALKGGIAECEKLKDYETRHILVRLLEDTEEDHTFWLEQQLGLIEKIGLQNYLQSAMS